MEHQKPWGKKLSKCCIIPQRAILAIMGFFCIVNCYTTRICLSHAITVMVKPQAPKNNTGDHAVCEEDPDANKPPNVEHDYEYDWSQALQGHLLGFFFAGYMITHLPGGILTDKFGGKWVLIGGMFFSGLTTILTPLAIYLCEAPGLIAMRAIMGLGQGVVFPALSGMLASWVPASERSKIGAVVMGGGTLGSILGNALSGLMLNWWKWPWLFYVFGGLTMLWVLLFFLLCFSYPNTHPYIKEKEYVFLESQLGTLGRKHKPPIPVCAILKNCPMYALVAAQIGHDWGLFVIVTDLPKYMADVLRMSVLNNGLVNALPFVVFWIVSIIFGFISDCLINKNYMSITNVRKLMTSIAAFGPGIFMVAASYASCDRTMVVILFTIGMGTMGPYFSGMKLSPLDMSPNFAGTLMAISNGIGAITGYLAPVFVGLMTPDSTLGQWRFVFCFSFGMLAVTAIIYCIWASGEVQPFDSPQEKKATEAKDK